MTHLVNNYARLPVTFKKGEGVWLEDTAGKRYLDAVAGVAVNTLGHAHPALIRAVSEQAASLIHTSNLYQVALQEQLAERLCRLAGMDAAFFCNSGAEANEAAIKLARLYGHQRGIDNPTIIVMEQSFHGRTMATLTATGSRKVQAGFEPLVSGFVRVPFDNIAAIEQLAANQSNIVAILVEPIQGEGGIHVPQPGYLKTLREICTAHGWLLMLDEVQTGIGRTGQWFAHQHEGVVPDVMSLAKGLGGGVPIGACLVRGLAKDVFKPGSHGSTFGGTPLACAAALAVLDTVATDDLCGNAERIGQFIRTRLQQTLADCQALVEVRGMGLMLGVELDRPCGRLVTEALAAGLLINVTHDTVIRLVPPLILGQDEANLLVDKLTQLIGAFLQPTS